MILKNMYNTIVIANLQFKRYKIKVVYLTWPRRGLILSSLVSLEDRTPVQFTTQSNLPSRASRHCTRVCRILPPLSSNHRIINGMNLRGSAVKVNISKPESCCPVYLPISCISVSLISLTPKTTSCQTGGTGWWLSRVQEIREIPILPALGDFHQDSMRSCVFFAHLTCVSGFVAPSRYSPKIPAAPSAVVLGVNSSESNQTSACGHFF